ncbi:L,D-transpeptidase family protein [Methylobacterium sp. WSM2598]|uniref:L,D-transpeptidase family protein n=1 Tax=Methylobacterium sp. WSM2598 TaxID=398261 RepID=UPI00038288A4|nr:murein L,D-transpeptidase family protein [Methylobacterium sp. WSM2598]
MAKRAVLAASGLLLALSLGACQDGGMYSGGSTRHLQPIPQKTVALMSQKGMSPGDPILIRAFKKESEMEVWKRGSDGRYALLKTFPICRWSGQLGPKIRQGDRQAPEGFYPITPGQMNPNSSYYLSFDTGFPNAFDRANNRTGTYLMVHGTCSSAGCFAMTDEAIAEIYAIAREAFAGGQRAFQFQSYPFRMNAENLAKYRNDPNMPFWKNLKEGSDYFEALHEEPRVGVCGTRYVFGGQDAAAGSCAPKVDPLVAEKRGKDEQQVAELIAKGAPSVRVVYRDGGQHPFFRETAPSAQLFAEQARRPDLGMVSRPEAIAAGPDEIPVDAKGRPILMAEAKAADAKAADAKAPDGKAHDGRAEAANGAAARKLGGAKPSAKPTALAFAAPAAEPPAIPSREAAQALAAAPAAGAAAPAPVTVASAEDDPSAYRKLLGNLFGTAAAPPTAQAALPPPPAPEPTPPAPRKAPHAHPAAKTSDAHKPAEAHKPANPKAAAQKQAGGEAKASGAPAKRADAAATAKAN